MKKVLLCFLLLISAFSITGCKKDTIQNEDAVKFKEEYENLNGKTNANGLSHREIEIPKNNPFVYATAKDIVDMIEDGETFYVYFGDTLCPWCRSVLEKAIEIANANNIEKIYYVKIWDDEGTEILRSKYQLNDSGEAEVVIEGNKYYYDLLNAFDSLLRDYTLTSEEEKEIKVGEKRIYAPNFVYVNNGVAEKLATGISELQTDPRMDLDENILKDETDIFTKFFQN